MLGSPEVKNRLSDSRLTEYLSRHEGACSKRWLWHLTNGHFRVTHFAGALDPLSEEEKRLHEQSYGIPSY
ncbi:hypothetical protein, partial [Pseudomonas viridiflava]|uniref:hypothetical protein n=1 Tax=Pseudomonas viridiflava TaxID=33069 RepID=UPI001981AC2F